MDSNQFGSNQIVNATNSFKLLRVPQLLSAHIAVFTIPILVLLTCLDLCMNLLDMVGHCWAIVM